MEVSLEEVVTLDEGFGIPSDDHVAVMFKALDDSHQQTLDGVSGVENISLAQVYAAGVLSNYSGGSVSGSESIFSSIGEGLKKVWEYIKGMFKNLWGFFFSKETAEKVEEKAEETDKEAKELEDRVNNNVSEEEANKNDNFDERKLEDLREDLRIAKLRLNNDYDTTRDLVSFNLDVIDNHKKLSDKQKAYFKLLKSDVEEYLKVSQTLIKPFFDTVLATGFDKKASGSVTVVMDAISKSFRENSRIIKRFSDAERKTKELIAELEKKIQGKTDDDEEISQIKGEIKALSNLMKVSVGMADAVKIRVRGLTRAKKSYKAIFGYK